MPYRLIRLERLRTGIEYLRNGLRVEGDAVFRRRGTVRGVDGDARPCESEGVVCVFLSCPTASLD
jgi:hypothetical protein